MHKQEKRNTEIFKLYSIKRRIVKQPEFAVALKLIIYKKYIHTYVYVCTIYMRMLCLLLNDSCAIKAMTMRPKIAPHYSRVNR